MRSAWAQRLETVRLYLVTGATPRITLIELIDAAIEGGVGMIQLREKECDDRALLALASAGAKRCRRHGVPFIVNDRADIALAAGADGVHLGQDDLPVAAARALLGPNSIIGLSTHSRAQIDAARESGADYLGVGPIHETPTKPGRPAVGAELIRYAAAAAAQPFFAVGGLDPSNVGDVIAAGAQGVSVLRWVTQSEDPARAAREMIAAMESAARDRDRGTASIT